MDKLRAMKTFVRIVETGSLTAAASSLDTSLPTVVRTLSALESDLGGELLKRTTRRLHITDEGSEYLERCRNILAAVEEARDIFLAPRTEPIGRLSVTASVLFGRRYLDPVLRDFLRRYPKVSADLLFVDRVVNLIEEGIDVAIRIGNLRDSSLVAVKVGEVRRVVCASQRYLRRHGVPKVPKDMHNHRCIRHTGLMPRSDWIFKIGKRRTAIPIDSIITSNEIDTAISACIEGLGLGMFLSYMVAPYRNGGQLRYLLEAFETEAIPVHVVYPRSKVLTNKVRVFVDECVRKLRSVRFD